MGSDKFFEQGLYFKGGVFGDRVSVAVPIVVGWERSTIVATKVTPISIIVEVVSRDKVHIYLRATKEFKGTS